MPPLSYIGLDIGSSYACIISGNCPLPTLQEGDIHAALSCNFTTNLLQCPCDDFSIMRFSVPYFANITNTTAAIVIDNIPDTISSVVITGNRAQQLYIGMRLKRVTFQTITRFSLVEPYFFDERGVGREIYRQNNRLITGALHDEMDDENRHSYETFCDGAFF